MERRPYIYTHDITAEIWQQTQSYDLSLEIPPLCQLMESFWLQTIQSFAFLTKSAPKHSCQMVCHWELKWKATKYLQYIYCKGFVQYVFCMSDVFFWYCTIECFVRTCNVIGKWKERLSKTCTTITSLCVFVYMHLFYKKKSVKCCLSMYHLLMVFGCKCPSCDDCDYNVFFFSLLFCCKGFKAEVGDVL